MKAGAVVAGAAALTSLAGCANPASGVRVSSASSTAVDSGALQVSNSQGASSASATASAAPYDGYFAEHEPLGVGKGLHPGRVSWAYGPGCVSWDGSGYWWELSHFDEAVVRALVDAALVALAGEGDAKASWNALFTAHSGGAGYQAGLHPYLTKNQMGIYNPLVDLMGHEQLGGKTVLYLLDAILCPSENTVAMTPANCTWEQSPFDGSYTASVIASQDPVAIDSVAADFLANEPMIARLNRNLNEGMENYLHEAALADAAPSDTIYRDRTGGPLSSLGVHEHWNNGTDKLYSRNLGADEGIELVRVDV